MSVKKALKPIIDLMEANPDKKVKEILPQAKQMAESVRSVGDNCIKGADNTVLAIVDGYDKRVKPLVGSKKVEFTKKASTSTGFNSYSVEGQKAWTERNDRKKAANQLLMDSVVAGKVTFDEKNEKLSSVAKFLGVKQGEELKGGTDRVVQLRKKVEAIAEEVKTLNEGFETKEQCIAYLKQEKFL